MAVRDERTVVDGIVFNALHEDDPRNRTYPMRLGLDPILEFFPRGVPAGYQYINQGPVLNQGRTGTCVAHGGRNWLNAAPLMTKGGPTPFEIYRGTVPLDVWRENDAEAFADDDDLQFGTSVLALMKYMQKQGHLANYLWAQTIEDVRAWLMLRRGVLIIGVAWTAGMFGTDSNGYIRPSGEVYGGHCVIVGGWNDNKRDPVSGVLGTAQITNSWGREWGRKGRAYVNREDLELILFDGAWQGECAAAVEQKVTPLAA